MALNIRLKQDGETPDYYWSKSRGDDTTGDGSLDNPWKTRSHAHSEMSIGDTCCGCELRIGNIISEKVS